MKIWNVKVAKGLSASINASVYERSGGFQGHAKDSQERLNGDNLRVDDQFIGKCYRYAYCYGGGGWQDVCISMLSAITLGIAK